MRTMTLEEHCTVPAFMKDPGHQLQEQAKAMRDHPQLAAGLAGLIERLGDLDALRIADMDAAGIDMQVLSLTSPGVEQLNVTEGIIEGPARRTVGPMAFCDSNQCRKLRR